jgi:rhodanese-related sulfurtransferase
VQETDVFAPVRGARIVLADDRGVRADMSASWLAQMGWEVYVLDGGFDRGLDHGRWRPTLPVLPYTPTLSAADLAANPCGHVVIDVAPSPVHHKGHIPGAWFAIRARLDEALRVLPADGPLVVTSTDGALARLATADLAALTSRPVRALEGGTAAWVAAGGDLETGLLHAASHADDIYRRPYEGTDNAAEAMQAYLDWEYGLVDQLARDGSHGFYVI